MKARPRRRAKAPVAARPRVVSSRLALPSGRSVVVNTEGKETLVIESAAGEVEVSIRFEQAGPVVKVSAGAIHLLSDSFVNVECETFRVRARGGIELETDGDIRQTVRGDQDVSVEGASRLSAREVAVEARDGDAELKSKADTRVVGGRVLINC